MIDKARHALRSALRGLVEGLTLHPENLEFEVAEQQIGLLRGLVVTLRVHRADFGRVLGKGGANFSALQTVAERIGAVCKVPVKLAPLLEPVVGAPERYKFQPNCNWPAGRDQLMAVVEAASRAMFAQEGSASCGDVDQETYRTKLTLRTHLPYSIETTKLCDALARLMDAAGRKHGRIIEMAFEAASADGSEWQPSSADGRFTKAEER